MAGSFMLLLYRGFRSTSCTGEPRTRFNVPLGPPHPSGGDPICWGKCRFCCYFWPHQKRSYIGPPAAAVGASASRLETTEIIASNENPPHFDRNCFWTTAGGGRVALQRALHFDCQPSGDLVAMVRGGSTEQCKFEDSTKRDCPVDNDTV